MTTALIGRFSLEALVASRDLAVAKYQEAARAIRVATDAAKEWDAHIPAVECRDLFNSYLVDSKTGELDSRFIKGIDRSYWWVLIAESGIRQVMSANAMHAMEKTVESDECPELTVANIEATFAGLQARRGEMFADLVESVYRRLSWDYKTNMPCRFGERMILGSAGDYWGSTPAIPYDSPLLELERVLAQLDGQPVPTREVSIQSQMKGAAWGQWVESFVCRPDGEPVFSVKLFRNRNAHLRVRKDLIEQMNKIIATRWPGRVAWA